MPFKPNYTDIRSFKIRDPYEVKTVGMTAANTQTDWKYLRSGTTTRGADYFLTDGIYFQNNNTNPVVISIQGLSFGTFISGATADGFLLNLNQNLSLKVNNLADIIVKSTSATVAGITLSYIAS